jgi:hypothetical protein
MCVSIWFACFEIHPDFTLPLQALVVYGGVPSFVAGSTLLVVAEVYQKASQDLRRVEILLTASDMGGAGFHLQQTAENYLKGCLLGKGGR